MTDEKQRAMMAADLAYRAAAAFTGGNSVGGINFARSAEAIYNNVDRPTAVYSCALAAAHYNDHAAVNAAVSAIQRGEWPADSLPARIAERRRIAIVGADEMGASGLQGSEALARGIAWGCREVLEMLGVVS